LSNIGYFRLSAYFYPLLKEPKTEHLYKDSATFDKALDMYRFDRSLLKKVAHQFGLPLPVFSSWIVLLVNLRNICGHHARLWNREIPFTSHKLNNPKFAWINSDNTDMKRVYFRICIIKYLLFTVSPNNRFTQKLKSLLAEYPTIDIRAMGFPANWENEPIFSSET